MDPMPTTEELRDLSRRSRRAQTWGFAAMLGALVALPAALVARAWVGETAAVLAASALGGALFVRWAYVVGEERGAFRRVFRRLSDDRRAMRRVPVADGSAAAPPEPAAQAAR